MAGKDSNKRIDLLNGNIASGLFWLALPIMGSQFIEVAYNLFDTMWVGHLGNQAVTAVGTAGCYLWIGQGISMIPQIGGQVMVGQAIGEGDMGKARRYARETVQLITGVMLVYSLITMLLRHPLIEFFRLNNSETVAMGISYLFIISFGHIMMGFNFVMRGLLTAIGDSRTSFRYNAAGLILNIVLDPLLIFGVGPFPEWGVKGAAIATVISESLVSVMLVKYVIRDDYLFAGFDLAERADSRELREIARLGTPPALFSIGFAFITMVVSRIIVAFGDAAVAIQKIGGQIESLSWMSSDGFAFAMNSVTAQNYGARKYDRVRDGFTTGMKMITVYGLFVTALLIIGAVPIFRLFINEPEIIEGGAVYLRIMGLSQLFVCYEITATGAFNGLGKTRLPAAVSMIITAARIPLFYILEPVFGGINLMWWLICITAILKGIVLLGAYMRELRRLPA